MDEDIISEVGDEVEYDIEGPDATKFAIECCRS